MRAHGGQVCELPRPPLCSGARVPCRGQAVGARVEVAPTTTTRGAGGQGTLAPEDATEDASMMGGGGGWRL